MSHINIPFTASSPIPPQIPTSFVENSGTAIPALNILDVLGLGSITTTGSGNTIDIALTGLTLNNVLYGLGTSTVGLVTAVNNGVLISSNTGVPEYLANGTVGYVLTANTGAPPSWKALPAGGVTSITGSANQILANATSGTPETGAVTLTAASPFLIADVAINTIGYGFTNNPTTGWGNNNNPTLYGYSNGVNVIQLGFNNIYSPLSQNQFTGGMTFNYNNKSGSYLLTMTDYAVFFDTAGGPYTATLPAAPNYGQQVVIKDSTGHAGTNNLTVSGNGNNIDSAATFVINTNYGWATFIFNSSTWSLI
jgi:hypothetical protein